ncbi:MAG TPA: hypothetical protein VEF72_23840 [Mycobacterium sp.]|nr:hypothetical protein [Mycobacterium sp.]
MSLARHCGPDPEVVVIGRAKAAFVLNGAVIGAPEIREPVNCAQLEISTYGEAAQQADAIVQSLRR